MNSNAPTRKQIARHFFRLMLISGSIFITFLILLPGLLTWHHRDSVKAMFADQLQQRMQAELNVKKIRFSLFRTFPMASLTLEEVTLLEAGIDQGRDTLLMASSVSLQFSIADIVRKRYNIRQIVVSDGILRPTISENGSPNYLFTLPDNERHDEPILFDIRRLLVNDIILQYTDHGSGHFLDCEINSLRLTGHFAGKHNSIKARGSLHLNELFINDKRITSQKDLNINADLETRGEKVWKLNTSRILIEGHPFIISGNGTAQDGQQWFDISVSGEQLPIARLLPELPQTARQALSVYEPEGILGFEGQISGIMQDREAPNIRVTFNIQEGAARLPQNNIALQKISTQGSFSNGNNRNASSSALIINTVKGETDSKDSFFNGNGSITNFATPYITLKLNAESAAGEFLQWLKIEHISQAEGRTGFDISFAGTMRNGKSFTGQDLLDASLRGTTSLSDVSFILNENHLLPYREFNGKMTFDDDRMVIEKLSGKAGSSDFHFAGNIKNLLPYLFIPDEVMLMEAIMHADHIQLEELLQHGQSENETKYKLKFSDRLQLEMDVSVEELQFGRFKARKLHGNTHLKKQILTADHLSFKTMDGSVQITGRIDGSQPEHISLHTNAHLDAVDIHQLFYQMGNFGQTGITDKNLDGSVTAQITFSSLWSPALEINWDSMETHATLRIEDGRLLNYAPMMALGRFIRTGDLDNISFSTLENEIYIRNRQVSIPMMEVSSNVLNLYLSGRHGFENDIEYRIRVLMSELMSRKHRERRNPQEQYGEIIDDGLGRTTLFLKLTGTAQDPVFRYDQAGVREKLRDDMREERETLRDIMRQEFSFLSRQPADTTDTLLNDRQEEMKRIKEQQEEGFIIEWE